MGHSVNEQNWSRDSKFLHNTDIYLKWWWYASSRFLCNIGICQTQNESPSVTIFYILTVLLLAKYLEVRLPGR